MGLIQDYTVLEVSKTEILQKPSGRYLANRRVKHRRSAIGIGCIAIASLIGYLLFSSWNLPPDQLPLLVFSVVAMTASVAVYIFAIQTSYYENLEFFDFPFFVIVALSQFLVNFAFFPLMGEYGSSEANTVAFNSAVLIAAGSVLVVGSFRSFLAIAMTLTILTVSLAAWVAPSPWHLTQLAPFATMVAVAIFVNFSLDRVGRASFKRGEKLKEYLYNVLPETVVARMREGEIIADPYSEISVIFCDVVGFSDMAKRLPPRKLVNILEDLFDIADRCADQLGVEKVKTIGDAYMAVSGGTMAIEDPASTAIEFGFRVLEQLEGARVKHGMEDLDLRISVHTGPAIGGIIGQAKKTYDYWGDTINVASRIQSCAAPGEIVTTEQTKACAVSDFVFKNAKRAELKGVGEVTVYKVGRRNLPDPAPASREPVNP